MIIGIPKERKTLEKRIALTPDGASKLVAKGHTVLIEKDAGVGSHFSNDSYKDVGCKIVNTLAEVWNESELVVKVKEPHEEEYQYFRKDVTLFDYLHLASMPDVTNAMLNGGLTGIAYELVQTKDGKLPLLEPMSEIAGKLSVLNGSYFLLSQNGGRGVLTGGAIGVDAAQVVIIGAGIAGRAACEIAVGMGADVTVLDISHSALERIKLEFNGRARGLFSTPASLARECANADLLIGAVLIPGAAAPKLITRDIIKSMKKDSVFVDISIDQGGCGETIKPTSLDNPVYLEEDVIHYGVCNMPAQVPVTSTKALTSATLPYIVELADKGISKAIKENQILRNAVNTIQGKLTNRAVSEAVGIKFTPIDEIFN
ncbi:MAG: alanine dehydrogenase [Bdellovibrionales bacterium]|nr:alanine dehydrogenase [Bdellovibrionales bacterium]